MEHKNTNDKNEYHFQLPEVVVKGKMPGWMRRQLGMALHRNPALFRKCMKNATSLEEKQFYFNLAFNAAREEAGQQFVQAALTAAGVISAISTAGVSLASATSFGRQAALLGRGALLKGSTYAGRIASSIEAASLRGGMAVQNTIMRSATHLRTLSNITGRMLYPKGLSFDTMLLMGGTDFTLQWGGNTIYKYTEENKTFINSMYESLNDVNLVSTLASSMKLPFLCNAVFGSSFNVNLRGNTKTVFDGGISTHEFLIDLGFGIGLGKVGENTYSNFFKNNTSKVRRYIPYFNEPNIQRILRNLHKYGDDTIDAMDKTIISLWGTYYINEVKKIEGIKNDTIKKKEVMKINRKKYIYTGGIILLIIIITTRYLDTLYYFNKANIRYTIGVYFKSGYYKGIIHQFKYRVADFDYIVDTRYGLHNKELNKLRIIVKYSEKWSEHSEIVMDTVPKWVLSPPKDGWKQFPPDINWKGAELDTAYMKKMGIAIPE